MDSKLPDYPPPWPAFETVYDEDANDEGLDEASDAQLDHPAGESLDDDD